MRDTSEPTAGNEFSSSQLVYSPIVSRSLTAQNNRTAATGNAKIPLYIGKRITMSTTDRSNHQRTSGERVIESVS